MKTTRRQIRESINSPTIAELNKCDYTYEISNKIFYVQKYGFIYFIKNDGSYPLGCGTSKSKFIEIVYNHINIKKRKITNPEKLINWAELSRLLSRTRSVVTQKRMPQKHEKKVNELLAAISKWQESLNN